LELIKAGCGEHRLVEKGKKKTKRLKCIEKNKGKSKKEEKMNVQGDQDRRK